MTGPRLTVNVDGESVQLMSVKVSRGFTNKFAPLTCGHQHSLGDTVWTRADLATPTVLLCDPCAQWHSRRGTP